MFRERVSRKTYSEGFMMDEMESEVRKRVYYRVREGFDTRAEIIESLTQLWNNGYDYELLEPAVIRITDELLAEHYKAQATWNFQTDCDRLDQAFARLNDLGIVARQHYSCCYNCGTAEIWDEVDALLQTQKVRGYAFYNQQDTESAYYYKHLNILYASLDNKPKHVTEIGQIIARTLGEVGLTVEWNNDPKKLIKVVNLDWKRRRTP
jgi:hypothetical protein